MRRNHNLSLPVPPLQNLPEVDLEATVLNRLAVLEVLCKNQAQTISFMQAENNRLRSSMTATTSDAEVFTVLPHLATTMSCRSQFTNDAYQSTVLL